MLFGEKIITVESISGLGTSRLAGAGLHCCFTIYTPDKFQETDRDGGPFEYTSYTDTPIICSHLSVGVPPRCAVVVLYQVLYAYGANRKAAQPCRMTLSGMGAGMNTKVRKLQGFDEWLGVTTDSRCYTEIFDKGT